MSQQQSGRLSHAAVKGFIRVSLVALGLGFSACTSLGQAQPSTSGDTVGAYVTGSEERVHLGSTALADVPDGVLSFERRNGQVQMWMAGTFEGQGGQSMLFSGGDLINLAPAAGGPVVMRPSHQDDTFDRDYAAPGAVVRSADGQSLLMVYHGENHQCGEGTSHNAIGLAVSQDNGLSWVKRGAIITNDSSPYSCVGASFRGAGQPSVIASPDGRYWYAFYNEWPGDGGGIRLARAERTSAGQVGRWWKFDGQGFTVPALGGGPGAAVINPPAGADFLAFASVSLNAAVGRYVAVLVGRNGFYFTSSTDLLHWEEVKLLWFSRDLTLVNWMTAGQQWRYYPSLLSADTASQLQTSANTYLYYALNTVQSGGGHQMYRRRVVIDWTRNLTPSGPLPGKVNLSVGTTMRLDSAWAWVCTGDLYLLRPERFNLYDTTPGAENTGLVTLLPPQYAGQVGSDWGGTCYPYARPDAQQGLKDWSAQVLTQGCVGGCPAGVNLLEVNTSGAILTSTWRTPLRSIGNDGTPVNPEW